MAPNGNEDGFAQGPEVADAPQGLEVQVAGEGGEAAVPAKVTLDLDDAPFMQEPPPEEKKPVAKAGAATSGADAAAGEGEDVKPKKSKKKLFIIAGAAVALLAILAAVYFLFLRGDGEAPPPPPEPPKPEVVVVPSKPKVEVRPDVIKELEPFIVPHAEPGGKMRFLYCKFAFVSKDPMLGQEVDSKLVSLRDSIFFYLQSKSTDYLMDGRNATTIKKELRGVVSDYLTRSKLDDVLLDSYLNE